MQYIHCPADALAVSPPAFDVVTCRHGLQFFGDRGRALREMRRALRGSASLRGGLVLPYHAERYPPVLADRDTPSARPFACRTYANGMSPFAVRTNCADRVAANLVGPGASEDT